MADVKVKSELKLDSNAANLMDDIQKDFEELQDEVRSSQSSMKDFGTQFAATFAALNLGPLLRGLGDMATSFISVGSAAYDTEQGIAGMLAGATGNEWNVARAYAEDLNAEFNNLSVNVGQAKEDIEAGHKTLVTFLGGTSRAFEVANNNMENLTTIANVQGLAVSELGMQFGKMSAGFVSMESPVFNLLRSTGIFSSDITKINQEWQKLTEEERIGRLEGAMASIADNLGKAPPTLSDMLTSVKAIGAEFMETFGKSAMEQFMGEMEEFRGGLQDARGDMRNLAEGFGQEFGSFIADAFQVMQKAVVFIRENGEEIAQSVKEGFQFARDTVSWILENRKELMMVGGAMLAAQTGVGGAAIRGVAGAAMGGAGAAASAMGGQQMMRSGFDGGREMAQQAAAMKTTSGRFGQSMKAMVMAGGPAAQVGSKVATGIGGLFTAVAAGGPVVWAAVAATAALTAGIGYMVSEMNEAEERNKRIIDDNLKKFTELSQKMGNLTEEELKRMDQLKEQAEQLGAKEGIRVSDDFDKAWADREDKILKAYVHPMQKIDEAVNRYAVKAEEEGLFPEEMGAQRMAINAAARLYENAWKAHDEGAMKYIAQMVGNSKAMRQAFLDSAEMTTEGFESFEKTIKGLGMSFSESFAEQIGNVARAEQERQAKKAAPQVNFNGGQVFKIQQNFRDQDPDRVVVSFQKGFTKAAISRVQAVTSTPFGT